MGGLEGAELYAVEVLLGGGDRVAIVDADREIAAGCLVDLLGDMFDAARHRTRATPHGMVPLDLVGGQGARSEDRPRERGDGKDGRGYACDTKDTGPDALHRFLPVFCLLACEDYHAVGSALPPFTGNGCLLAGEDAVQAPLRLNMKIACSPNRFARREWTDAFNGRE
jgi:hypothetical protein